MTNKPSFSQRQGITPVKNQLQIDSMDAALRNSLWNALELFFWKQLGHYLENHSGFNPRTKGEVFFETVWVHFFKFSLHTLHPNWQANLERLQREFFSWPWNQVYDFMDFTVRHFPGYDIDRFKLWCNAVLERELSGYRFVGDMLVPITSKAESAAVEEALNLGRSPSASSPPY